MTESDRDGVCSLACVAACTRAGLWDSCLSLSDVIDTPDRNNISDGVCLPPLLPVCVWEEGVMGKGHPWGG